MATMKPFQSRSILVLVLFIFSSLIFARDTITPTQPLADNELLISSAGLFALGFFTPSHSMKRYLGIWFNNITDRRIVWVANRSSPVINSTGLLSITSNGTIMILNQDSAVVWSAPNTTSGIGIPVAQLLDNGNFVVKEDNSSTLRYAWQSFDYPTDTLLAGMKLGLNWITGLRHGCIAWKGENDPSEGEYSVVMDTDTDIYLYSFSYKIWRSGPWDGINFRRKGLNYTYVNNSQELEFSFQANDQPVIFVANQLGKVQLLTWMPDSEQWDVFWEEPANQCDIYGQCGPNGICNIETSPICNCFQGYVPKNPVKWASADWADGCIRKTEFDCTNGTDGFVMVSNAKLPESQISLYYTAFSLDECRLLCLHNCSCTACALDGSGNGCVIWVTSRFLDVVQINGFDQDLYLRIASADLATRIQSLKRNNTTWAIAVSLTLGTLLLVACVACFLWKRKKRRNGTFSDKSKENNEDLDIPLYDFGTIEAATDNFSTENELGHGGFGTVYKGMLGKDQEIAVKRLGKTSLQGTNEFKNEVMLIAKLQNRNLVRLLGCCIQGEEKMLIYEYMPNISLDSFLFDKEKVALLDWQTRYQIIIGIARGLLYLHHDSIFRIIHRDLKASNILLDEEMHPKISDFGMARLFAGNTTDFNTKKVVGTYGYMSPEYAMGGIFSLKSDVYSYGVLILEIISGKKNRGVYEFSSYLNLLAHAWSLWSEGKSFELVDVSISNGVYVDDVLKCIKVGLLCVQDDPDDRPLISSVIVMLGTDITSLPEPKKPSFVASFLPGKLDQISDKQDSATSNDMTITLDAR